MKISLVQINPVIGDFEKNCNMIIEGAKRSLDAGCRLAIFPELAVCGYPPQDLLERSSFVKDHDEAIERMIQKLPEIDVLFGCLESFETDQGKHLYNSAFVVRNKEIIYRARKQLLPSYDVFDETRYFQPGPPSSVYTIDSMELGVTICEDVWREEVHEYTLDPLGAFFSGKKRVDGIINISASPFHKDKDKIRQRIFQGISTKYRCPFIYCNQVGGQDSLLFDGRSMVLDKDGQQVARGKSFEEDLVVVDTEMWSGDIHEEKTSGNTASVYKALVMGVRDYVHKCGFSSAVLGLSGGIDSALTAAIAVEALGAENVIGVALPSVYSSAGSLQDAKRLAENLGCRFETISIASLVDEFRETLAPLFADLPEDITEQNIQARVRGNLLMALSNKFGNLLLTTGNKSEMAVGYCTLYGDMSGGLAVISDVPKQLVYELSRFVNREREIIPESILTKAPSAELKPDQTDQDDLPPYDILDQILELHLEGGKGKREIIAEGFEPAVVEDIIRRVRINEYKRKQAPMGLKVTTKAFGFGRRYPNVQNYRS